jgi:hypothetical protein
MSGRLVLVRTYGDKVAVREVLHEEDGMIIVCRPENAAAIRAGERPEPMIGFRHSDVFAYDEAAEAALGEAKRGNRVDWNRLRPAK